MVLSYHGTEGSSLMDCCSAVTIQSSASTRQLIATGSLIKNSRSPRVHRSPGTVKSVRPHGIVLKNTLPSAVRGTYPQEGATHFSGYICIYIRTRGNLKFL